MECRVKRPKRPTSLVRLTDDQRRLAEEYLAAFDPLQEGFKYNNALTWACVGRHGPAFTRQQCHIGVLVAAGAYDPAKDKGSGLGAMVVGGIRNALKKALHRTVKDRRTFTNPFRLSRHGVVADERSADPPDRRPPDDHLREEMEVLMSFLSPTERYVIWARYLRRKKATLAAVGRTLGYCRERVRQIEETALYALRLTALRRGNVA